MSGAEKFPLHEAVGQRVSIRLREGESYRDLLGVLDSETSIIRKDGSRDSFSPADIAFFRIVPVFNRRDIKPQPLSLYETASRSVREISGELIRIYMCGPTVYRDAHVGNMRTFLLGDLITRALAMAGSQTLTVQNITDVGHMSEDLREEDKVLEEAHRTSVSALEVARSYESKFRDDLALLNIEPTDYSPRASENMDSIIEAIEKLIAKEYAYCGSDGNIYFDAQKFDSYGSISGNRLDALKPGHRYEYSGDGGKRFHADWALWKLAANRSEMVWPSPWGVGFPGWHIECTAMSLGLLGDRVDLHIGGIDLRFPHHENERAQTNAIAGHDVVSHWIHGEHLLFEGRKMSKSAGNVVLVSDIAAAGLDPLALRLNLLENRYRSQMDLSWDSLRAADITLKRWRSALASWGTSSDIKFDAEINSHLMTDLDTPRALIRLREIEKDSTMGVQDKRAIFLYADSVLGLDLDRAPEEKELSEEALQLLAQREQARKDKNWAESDRLRDLLTAMGVEIRDGKL
jgi:cysteinyl-tRNA synthetase